MPESAQMVTPAQRKWLPWLTAVGFFMQTLDGTILNTALPNMAETLAAMHICGGQQANELIDAAQRALAAVHSRQQITASWTLYASEIEALGCLTTLRARQLAACGYSEFERALQRTHNRVSAARAGNAPRGAIVVIGDMA